MGASLAIQILPVARDDEELCKIVDEVIEYIISRKLRYEVGPFETTIEGDNLDELMQIATECLKIANRAGSEKVSAYIKVVYNPNGEVLSIDKKIDKYKK